MRAVPSILLLFIILACDGDNHDVVDARPSLDARACGQSFTYTTLNQPPCTWEWTCNDFTGQEPQYAAMCVAADGDNVACECRQAGVVTGNFTVQDGCISFVGVCEAANVGCGFTQPITCAE